MSAIFFFQAEDGIRDVAVTGVQTCALPICYRLAAYRAHAEPHGNRRPDALASHAGIQHSVPAGNGSRGNFDAARGGPAVGGTREDRKSTRLNSSHGYISYAVFCLKKKTADCFSLSIADD